MMALREVFRTSLLLMVMICHARVHAISIDTIMTVRLDPDEKACLKCTILDGDTDWYRGSERLSEPLFLNKITVQNLRRFNGVSFARDGRLIVTGNDYNYGKTFYCGDGWRIGMRYTIRPRDYREDHRRQRGYRQDYRRQRDYRYSLRRRL